jgi:hypothetical protein
MTESLKVKRNELGHQAQRVLEAVQRGEIALVEDDGKPEAAILDIVDYRLLRAFVHCHARPEEFDLSPEPTDERFAGLDEQGRYDLVMAYYQTREPDQGISLGRMAELLGRPMVDIQLRCARLGIPLWLGPQTIEELREEIAVAERIAGRSRAERE